MSGRAFDALLCLRSALVRKGIPENDAAVLLNSQKVTGTRKRIGVNVPPQFHHLTGGVQYIEVQI
jgi:hypothetical protein